MNANRDAGPPVIGAAVELGAGTGVVAAIGDTVLFVADSDAAEPLVATVREVAGGAARSGRLLARRLGALLTGGDADGWPAFGVLTAIDDGWVVLVHGVVSAAIVTSDGREELVAGTSSVTWTDRIVPINANEVLIGPAGLARPGASPSRLERGVVPGGWLRVAFPRSDQATAPPVAFEQFSLAPGGVEARPPLEAEGMTSADTAAPAVGPSPTGTSPVGVGDPAGGHQRISLGLLVFDDGSAFGLDTDYVLGREPETDDSVAAGHARPIALDDPADTVSRVHAEIHIVEPDVQLIDRGSTNGTHLWDDARGLWDQLAPGEPRVIRPGERGAIGRRTFVYEATAKPAGPAGREQDTRPAPETVAVAQPVGSLVRDNGAAYPLDRSYVIGREPLSDDSVRRAVATPIVVRDDEISRVHAHVVVNDGVSVRDAGTPRGTFVAAPGASEWEPVGDDPVVLAPGWSIRVGRHVFTFRDGR